MTILAQDFTTLPTRRSASPVSVAPSARRLPPRSTVSRLLDHWGPWVCCMALIGMCEDGIPLAARFFNPQLGTHYAFFADDPMVLPLLVEPMLYSIAYQGRVPRKFAGAPDEAEYAYGPGRIRYGIISPPDVLWNEKVVNGTNSAGVAAYGSPQGRRILAALHRMIEQRRERYPNGLPNPVVTRNGEARLIVLLHDVGRHWYEFPEEDRALWKDILRHGHHYGVHVVATLRYGDAGILPAVPSQRIYGKMTPPGARPPALPPERPDGRALPSGLPQRMTPTPAPNAPLWREVAAMGMADPNLPPYVALTKSEGQWLRVVIPSV